MFTGIVQGQAQVTDIIDKGDLKTFSIHFPTDKLESVERGASIALNGVCLTVTAFDLNKSLATFDVMDQSLRLTNLSDLSVGSGVNFERAAKFGDEIGGHLMSGHIFQTAILQKVESVSNKHILHFELAENIKQYIFPKGFVGINGCSLTIADTFQDTFTVHLIPETLEVTTFRSLEAGHSVNIEVDPQTQAIVDTVNNYMDRKRTDRDTNE